MPPRSPRRPPTPNPELPSLLSNRDASVELMSFTGASGSLAVTTTAGVLVVSFEVTGAPDAGSGTTFGKDWAPACALLICEMRQIAENNVCLTYNHL